MNAEYNKLKTFTIAVMLVAVIASLCGCSAGNTVQTTIAPAVTPTIIVTSEPITPTPYDFKDMLADYLNGKITSQFLLQSDSWDYSSSDQAYISRLEVENDEKIYILFRPDSESLETFYDSSKDSLFVKCDELEISIENPSSEMITELIIENLIPTEYSRNQPNALPNSIDINKDDGHIITYIARLIIGKENLGSIIEERNMTYTDGCFTLSMFTVTDTYTLKLVTDENIDRELNLDYSTMSLTLENTTDNWVLENPTSEEVIDSMSDEYLAQREQWKELYVDSQFSGNYIQVYTPKDSMIEIPIPEDMAKNIVYTLKNPDEMVTINDLKDTEYQYNMYGIEIFLEDMNYEYPVPMWANKQGKMAFGYANEPIPVSQQAADTIIEILTANFDFEKISLNEITDLVSVELIVEGKSKGVVTDSKDLSELQNMFSQSINLNGSTKCPFGAKLLLKKSDGTTLELQHATDSCSVFILGTFDYYKYENVEKLLEYFDMTYIMD